MLRFSDPRKLSSSRRRLSELKERKRTSAAESINKSRTTILINMTIAFVSGILFAVGIIYIIRIIHIRKPFIEPGQYKLLMGVLAFIVCAWIVILSLRIRKYFKLYRKVYVPKDQNSNT